MPIASTASSKIQLLNQEEAADVLQLHPRTLEGWRCRGGGPPFVRVGRRIRYRLEDLEEWIEGQTFRSTTEADLGEEPSFATRG